MNQAVREMDRSAMMRLERMARTSEPGSSNDYLYLKARLEEEKARVDRHGGVMSLLYLQLEDYNRIKTEYGGKITDEVLNQLGEEMVMHLRRYDALRRIHPNRYLVLLPQTNRRDARKVGQSLIQMGEDYTYELPAGGSVSGVLLTCGIAAYPINGDGVENVVTAAHSACQPSQADAELPITVSEQFIRTDSSGEQVVSEIQKKDT
jgi:diguanylate cyclase (GGDEF)-like protein